MMDPCDPKHDGAIFNILKYFIIIIIVSTNYIFVHLLDNTVLKSSLTHGTNMKNIKSFIVLYYSES